MKARREKRCALHAGLSLLLALGLIGAASSAWGADPLDEVKGTEQWRQPPIEDPEAEWDSWLKDRIRWRGALRELQLERNRNRRLARHLRVRGGRRAPPAPRKKRAAPPERPKQAPAAPPEQPKQAPAAPTKPSPPPPVEDDKGVITID